MFALLLLAAALSATSDRRPATFLPVAVWYGGGKVRAPMLEADPRAHINEWRSDLRQIAIEGVHRHQWHGSHSSCL